MNRYKTDWDKIVRGRYNKIVKYVPFQVEVSKVGWGLILNKEVIIAKKKPLFTLTGKLDWVWYTPKGLGMAIASGEIEEYYNTMLTDERSPKNEWKDKEKEQRMKEHYGLSYE